MKKHVRIERVGQTFATRKGDFVALRDIDLTVDQGEFITLIGHSGCGKSTLLNLIAGLTRPTTGVLLCAEREITGPGPDRAVVFQNHSLLPWLTCFQNVHLAVERVFGGSESRARLAERTRAALELVGLLPAQNKLPREISGGMKQRVGIAGAGDRAGRAADGRTVRRAGRADARASAGRAAQDRGQDAHHHHHGHARRGRGRAAVGPHRHAGQRAGRHHRRDPGRAAGATARPRGAGQ